MVRLAPALLIRLYLVSNQDKSLRRAAHLLALSTTLKDVVLNAALALEQSKSENRYMEAYGAIGRLFADRCADFGVNARLRDLGTDLDWTVNDDLARAFE